jgi:hypothetical protein
LIHSESISSCRLLQIEPKQKRKMILLPWPLPALVTSVCTSPSSSCGLLSVELICDVIVQRINHLSGFLSKMHI